MLTGECKKEFEKWKHKLYKEWVYNDTKGYENYGWSKFNELPQSMQYGVYVDYFDSVRISISCYRISKKWVQYDIIDYLHDDFNLDEQESYKTRQEAREQAILKACEIRNKQLEDELTNQKIKK